MKKKMLVSLLVLSVLSVLFVSVPVTAADTTPVKVYVNGEKVFFPDQQPFVVHDVNRTYVVFRFVLDAMGFDKEDTQWDGYSQTATAVRGNDIIKMQVGSCKPTVNGRQVTIDAPAIIQNNRLMVPLRFVSEAVGAEVQWDGREQSVYITDKSDRHHYSSSVFSSAMEEFANEVEVMEEVSQLKRSGDPINRLEIEIKGKIAFEIEDEEENITKMFEFKDDDVFFYYKKYLKKLCPDEYRKAISFIRNKRNWDEKAEVFDGMKIWVKSHNKYLKIYITKY